MAGSDNPLGLEDDDFEPGEQPQLADDDVDLEGYTPPERTLLEWTPERAGAIVRIAGYTLHTADGITSEPGGEDLWRATQQDVDAIGPPLSRILNRYAPARRLAGVADEGEFAFAMLDYAKRNISQRGRVVAAKRKREELEAEAEAAGGVTWHEGVPPGGELG